MIRKCLLAVALMFMIVPALAILSNVFVVWMGEAQCIAAGISWEPD